MGKILAICTSPKRGTVKTEVPSAVLTPEWGIVSDAHGGNWHRQVSLLSAEKIEAFRKKIWVDYGAFGENLVIEGFDFRNLPVTSRFAIGDVVLEMTQIGKECHSDYAIRRQTGDCIMPREGVFARVVKGGTIHTGDEMKLLRDIEKVTRQKIPVADRRNDKQLAALDASIMAAGVAKTFKVNTLTDSITLTNADVLLRAEYFDVSGSYLGTFVSSAPASPIASSTSLPTNSAAWASVPPFSRTLPQAAR